MEECTPPLNTGLRGVKVASTKISHVDGAHGKLIYRGYLVKDLAEQATYEEVVHLLLHEHLPGPEALADIRRQMVDTMVLPQPVVDVLKTIPPDTLPMDVLQAAVAVMASQDPDVLSTELDAYERMALRLTARLPTLLAAWGRIRSGQEPIDPDPKLGVAANFLYMLTGRRPAEDEARFFDVCLILHAEHSFNASTFSARQVASTRAHMYAAVAGAIGSLSGELHGGANVRVMEMLKAIGSEDKVADYVASQLEAGKLIFGLGHAVYQVDDPRALILAPMSQTLCERTGQPHWFNISKTLEATGKAVFKERKGIDIFVNVDFYSASLYYAMGIPIDLFTPVFAISRITGWAAHVIEERFAQAAPKATLYRPKSEYIGEYCGPDECSFVPVDER